MDDVAGDRVAGINRYGTAAAVAGQTDFDGATTAILATGETFPDALAASGLAGSNNPAPIILTTSDAYSSEAEEALNNLTSITDVIIVGGTAAISQDVEDAVEADGFAVSRVAGTDRYGTAAEIAAAIGTLGEVDGLVTAFIATGTGFADALAGGPLSYDLNSPILLVQPSEIPAATSSALTDLGIEQVIILGGTAAVSDAVETELEDIVGSDAIRVAGLNRFGTAAAVGEYANTELGWAPTEVLLANGLNFPDALAGGPLGGERDAPIILTASLPDESAAFLDLHSDTITSITALGGTAAVDSETLQAAEEAAEETGNDTDVPTEAGVTARPELISASITRQTTAAQETPTTPRGTVVQYCFDEAVTGAAPVVGSFHLWRTDGTQLTPAAGSGPVAASATVDSTDNKCVNVLYSNLDTSASFLNISVATVDAAAVADPQESTPVAADVGANPEGAVGLTPAGSGAAAAGVTEAPDLASVGNFRAGSTADITAVDFTFDEAAFTQAGAEFQLVDNDGVVFACDGPGVADTTASGGTVPGGRGTTVITATCVEPGTSVAHSATTIARGTVGRGSVGDATGGGNLNPLQAAPVSANGNTADPDLDGALFLPDAVANVDVVAFIFDEAVDATTDFGGGLFGLDVAPRYHVYQSTGAQLNGTTASRSPEGNNIMAVTFADGALATAVGSSVDPLAANEADGANGNERDEVAVSPPTSTAPTAGRTDGPDLIEARGEAFTNAFGGAARRIVYVFDEDTNDLTVVTGEFFAYLADGQRLTCTTLSPTPVASDTRTEDTDNTLTCTAYTIGGIAATQAQIGDAVLATVEDGAVIDEATTGADPNPEGDAAIDGSTGTPSS